MTAERWITITPLGQHIRLFKPHGHKIQVSHSEFAKYPA